MRTLCSRSLAGCGRRGSYRWQKMLCADREQKNLTAETEQVQGSVLLCGRKAQFLLLGQRTLSDPGLDLASPKLRRQEVSSFTEEERQHTGKENASGSELRPPPVTRPVLLPACPPRVGVGSLLLCCTTSLLHYYFHVIPRCFRF